MNLAYCIYILYIHNANTKSYAITEAGNLVLRCLFLPWEPYIFKPLMRLQYITLMQLFGSIIRYVQEWNNCIAAVLYRVIEGTRKCVRSREHLGWTSLSVSNLLFTVHNRRQWVSFTSLYSGDGVWHDMIISINCIMRICYTYENMIKFFAFMTVVWSVVI